MVIRKYRMKDVATVGVAEVDDPVHWPYGPSDHHQDCCNLHRTNGVGFCDCLASDASDREWGMGS